MTHTRVLVICLTAHPNDFMIHKWIKKALLWKTPPKLHGCLFICYSFLVQDFIMAESA
eukprot:c38131_g1_i1 orf=137-310(+)